MDVVILTGVGAEVVAAAGDEGGIRIRGVEELLDLVKDGSTVVLEASVSWLGEQSNSTS